MSGDLGDFEDPTEEDDGQTQDEPEEPMTEADETHHNVQESADKIVLKADVKRGEGTRDQDKIKVKVKGSQPAPTADKLARVLDCLDELGVSQQLRETQPGENDE